MQILEGVDGVPEGEVNDPGTLTSCPTLSVARAQNSAFSRHTDREVKTKDYNNPLRGLNLIILHLSLLM